MISLNGINKDVSNVSLPGGPTPTVDQNLPSGDIDQEGFLTLLVAQLQNQDPLEPLSNEEFVQQLTSFSQLDELTAINENLASLDQLGGIQELLAASIALQQTNVNAAAVGLIGQEVEVYSNAVMLGPQADGEIMFENPGAGTTMTVQLTDTSGNVVYEDTFSTSAPPDGVRIEGDRIYYSVPLEDSNGSPLPETMAQITVSAATAAGPIALDTFLMGRVQGIDFSSQQTLLTVSGTPVDIVNVVAVREPGTT